MCEVKEKTASNQESINFGCRGWKEMGGGEGKVLFGRLDGVGKVLAM